MYKKKLTSITEAVKNIKHGSSVFFHGSFDPVSFACILAGSEAEQLNIISYKYCISADLLCRIGKAVSLLYCSESSGALPFVSADSLKAVRLPDTLLRSMLEAGRSHMPFCAADTIDIPDHSVCDSFITKCSLGTDQIQLAAAIRPNVSIIQVPMADIYGNAFLDPADDLIRYEESHLALCSDSIIICADQIISGKSSEKEKRFKIIDGSAVCAVAEVPYGSYPSCGGARYLSDKDFIRQYNQAAASDESFKIFAESNMTGFASESERIAAVGFQRLMKLTVNRRGEL